MICEQQNCTGCGLCTEICPKACITLKKNKYGSFKYEIDEEQCIHCEKCKKMCPQVSKVSGNIPIKCYAGYALEPSERATSSSGGIASALYRCVLENGGAIVGACYNDGEFCLKITEKEDDIKQFKGSKYVNCTSKNIFKAVKEKIEQGKQVLFIGTPCQVASIKSYIGDSKLLYTVDLICHGTPPQTYFEEHFKAFKKGITSVNFRENGKYHLKMDGADGNAYRIDGGTDEYYLSFINGITFNDCCYECSYAKTERVSDITIGDFWGIDEEIKKSENIDRISLLLCNTLHGAELLNSTSGIRLIERNFSEALPQNQQLIKPFPKNKDRIRFEEKYPILGFDKTIHRLGLENLRRKNILLTLLSKLKHKLKKN